MCGASGVGRTRWALASALVALLMALALALLVPASATAAPTVRVRTLERPPAQLEQGERFLVRVRVTRQGTGFRSAVLAFYLTPRQGVGAGAVRLAGRTSLAPLLSRRQFERPVRIGVPRSVSEGRYYLTACVVVLRGNGIVGRRPCRVSQRRVLVAAPSSTDKTQTDKTQTDKNQKDKKEKDKDQKGKNQKDKNQKDENQASAPPDEKPDDPTRIAIFPWVTSGGFEDNWKNGIGFAALGLMGAVVLLFFSLGEFLPAMGGKAEYLARKAELDNLIKQRTSQFELREAYVRGEGDATEAEVSASAALTEDLETSIQEKQRDVNHERNRLLTMGMFMYAVLGAAFAVLFAANALQAILIGFGWTAVAQRFGLKREVEERNTARQEAIEDLRKDAQTKLNVSDKKRVAAEARAEEHAKAALLFGEEAAKAANARKRAEHALAAARGQTPQPPESPEEPE